MTLRRASGLRSILEPLLILEKDVYGVHALPDDRRDELGDYESFPDCRAPRF